jgi:hypothetical protein
MSQSIMQELGYTPKVLQGLQTKQYEWKSVFKKKCLLLRMQSLECQSTYGNKIINSNYNCCINKETNCSQ